MSTQSTVPTTKKPAMYFVKGFLLTCLLGVILLAVMMAVMSKGVTQCESKDHDTCVLQAIELERKDRDAFKEAREQEITEYVTAKDATIESYKEQLSPKTIEQEFKANRSQNVPTRLLKLMIPEAQADSSANEEISLSTDEGKSIATPVDSTVTPLSPTTSPLQVGAGRYDALLAKYDAPYKNVNIEKYCNEAGLVQWRCDIMVAIAQQESQMGKDFHCISQTDAYSITLGQTYYHNPMGLMDKNVHWKNGRKTMDFQGCFLRKFDSWDAFWKFMPQSFMDPAMRYNVNNWNTVEELSGIWVTGNKSTPNKDWYTTVKGVIKKI